MNIVTIHAETVSPRRQPRSNAIIQLSGCRTEKKGFRWVFDGCLEGGEKTKIHYKMSTKTPLPTVNEKATESVSIKGLFVGRVSSKLAQLLRHCIRLSVKVHPEGGFGGGRGFPPNLLRISGVLCCLPALFFHTWCSTLLMNRKQAYSQRQTRH